MESDRWAISFDARAEMETFFQASEIVIRELALITKSKADGSVKRRFIWDFLHSLVDSLIHQGERIILPRLSDYIEGILLEVCGST
jgi:hypothetical protein